MHAIIHDGSYCDVPWYQMRSLDDWQKCMPCSEVMLCPIKAVEAAFAKVRPSVSFLYLNLLPTPCKVINVPGGTTHLVHLMHAHLLIPANHAPAAQVHDTMKSVEPATSDLTPCSRDFMDRGREMS